MLQLRDPLFEEKGGRFRAVQPWLASVVAPTVLPAAAVAAYASPIPSARIAIDWVYGTRTTAPHLHASPSLRISFLQSYCPTVCSPVVILCCCREARVGW